MRSLKECYEIARNYHTYWTGDPKDPRYMCIALEIAAIAGKITIKEFTETVADSMSLVEAHSPGYSTLKGALSCAYRKDFTDAKVKEYWDKYIDNM